MGVEFLFADGFVGSTGLFEIKLFIFCRDVSYSWNDLESYRKGIGDKTSLRTSFNS